MGVLGADTSVPPIPGEAGAVQVAVRLGVTCWNGHKGEKQVWGWGSVGERSGPPFKAPIKDAPFIGAHTAQVMAMEQVSGPVQESQDPPITQHRPSALGPLLKAQWELAGRKGRGEEL